MSIRNVDKDHLRRHGNLKLVASDRLTLQLPDHQDPLKFWTYHPTENRLVDLTVFADGHPEGQRRGKRSEPFSGRPRLIRQLSPLIQEAWLGIPLATVGGRLNALRAWWRVLDAVEVAAAKTGQPMDRVDDVRQLTRLHHDFAHRSGMRAHPFRAFLRIANIALRSLGAPPLHWSAPEDPEPKRCLPPEDQILSLRIALKQEWASVRRRWAMMDHIGSDGFQPKTDEESNLLAHYLYFRDRQRKCGNALPSPDDLRGEFDSNSFSKKTGLALVTLRTMVFPDRWEADTAFHLCLAHTGWNPAVLFSLDVQESFLGSHPKDPNRYLLVGTKIRAGGMDQPVTGLWKTTWGAGPVIKLWMARTAPLRTQLESMLAAERVAYKEMTQRGASPEELTQKLGTIQRLEQGARSVWLFVGAHGEIGWLHANNTFLHTCNGTSATYLMVLLDRLNKNRVSRGEEPVPAVTASDFRDIFALYVWRVSGGNILAVMRALNHAHLRTTERYVDNNILNAERDQQARTFLDHLFAELDEGRLDLAILAHMQRYGTVTNTMEQRLVTYRKLQRSRLGVACRDPFHPPMDIEPESRAGKLCAPQRCLICKPNAVILPESLWGIAMRIEELEVMHETVPLETWLNSPLPAELCNGLDVLRLFSPDDVRKARAHWKQAITAGMHRVPGLHAVSEKRDAA